MKKSLLKFLVIGMVAALVLTGCGQQAAQNTGDDGAANNTITSTDDSITNDSTVSADDDVANSSTASADVEQSEPDQSVGDNYNPARDSDGYYIYTVYGQELRCKTNIWDFIDEDAKTYDIGKFRDYTGCELYVQGEYCFKSFTYAGNRNSSELSLVVVKVDPSTMVIDKSEMYLFEVKYDPSAFALYEYTIAGASREVGLTLDQIILHTYAVEHLMENLQDKPFGELFTEYLVVDGSGKQFTYTLP